MLMIDVDGFKLFNDRFGHQAGDECLFGVAAELQSVLRKQGVMVARYGGEEFAAVLPDTDGTAACRKAGEIRAAVEDLRLSHPDMERGYVTVSIGVAAARIEANTAISDELLCRADRALYEAKATGRNRVQWADALPTRRDAA